MVQSPYSSLICLCLPLWSFPPPVELRIPSRFLESLWKINMAFSYKTKNVFTISSVQSLGHVQFFATPWTAASQASLSITNSQSLLKLTSIPQWCHPTILSSVVQFSSHLQSFPASGSFQMSQFFASGGQGIGVSASVQYSGLISFRIDWLDLLAVQGTLKSLLQHPSSKASILLHSALFIVQLSYPYMTTGKMIALTRRILVGKVMSLLFNMLSRLVIAFLPKSKHLLISWLQSPSAVFLEPAQNKVSHCFHCDRINNDTPSLYKSQGEYTE